MKRDMELVRQILLKIEEDPKAIGYGYVNLDIPGRDEEEVNYHIMILDEQGLIKALKLPLLSKPTMKPQRLTAAGHEFLDAYRSDTLWNKGKDFVVQNMGGLTLEALKQAIPIITRMALGG